MWDLYNDKGIELPHPQRDLTLRNPDALAQVLAASAQRAANTTTLSSRADQRN
jgi:small-conductance mechanosensitive channel